MARRHAEASGTKRWCLKHGLDSNKIKRTDCSLILFIYVFIHYGGGVEGGEPLF